MICVLPDYLWIGNALEARDLKALFDLEIQAVVDLAINEPPAQLTREMIYCRVPILDGAAASPALHRLAIETVVTLVRGRFRTLVACSAGMSRSPAVAGAAVALLDNRSPDACLARITARGPHDVSPALWAAVLAAYRSIEANESI